MKQGRYVSTERIQWIDFAKGIAILATIVGHTVEYGIKGSYVRGMIFSFHMPLFFILSMVTYKNAESINELTRKAKKAFFHLIMPAIIVFFIYSVFQCMQDFQLIGSLAYWKEKLYTFVFASGVSLEYGGTEIKPIGMLWFFFALYLGRVIFDYLYLNIREISRLFIVTCICGIFGVILGQTQWLPFSMDISLAVQPFLLWGYSMKKKNMNVRPVERMFIWGILWVVLFFLIAPDYNNRTYLELACRRYPLFPICYIGAIAGTMAVSYFSALCSRFRKIFLPLIFIGKNSLYMFCAHALDSWIRNLWYIENHQFISAIRRCLVDVVIFCGIMLMIYIFRKLNRKAN